MRATPLISASALLLLVAHPATAQQTVAPELLVRQKIDRLTAPWLQLLREAAAKGDSLQLAKRAREALDDLARRLDRNDCCNASEHYFLVVFVAPDASGASAPVTVIVHDPAPDTMALPGLSGNDDPLFEVALTDDLTSVVQTTYAITHDEDPAEKQIGDFVSRLVGGLRLPLSTAVETANRRARQRAAAPTDETPSLALTFSRVALPNAGKLTVRHAVLQPLASRLNARFEAIAAAQQAELENTGDGVGPACGDFAGGVHDRVIAALGVPPCGAWIAESAACARKLNGLLAIEVPGGPGDGCPPAVAGAILQDYADAVDDLKPVTGTITIGNARQVRYGFGLAAAYIASIGVDPAQPRATMHGGSIEADPFTRVLLMGVVNLTPWGYDPQRLAPSIAERLRLFVGAAFSPYFGVTGGGAFALNRYIAFTAGYARLWFDTPKAGEQIGRPPTAANSAAPFDLASTGALFFGVGYNFK